MLGFDISPERTKRLLAEWKQWPETQADGDIGKQEDEILNIFVDICSLFRTNPKYTADAEEAPSTEAYLFSYLRMLDTQGENLPEDFLAALRRAVAHYGVTSLDRSPELEESLLWMYKSHQGLEQQISPIVGVLERRLQAVRGAKQPADEAFRTCLTAWSRTLVLSSRRERPGAELRIAAAVISRCSTMQGGRSMARRKRP